MSSTSGAQGLIQSTLPSNEFSAKESASKPPPVDNSAPPGIKCPTPETKKEGITFEQFFISILFLVLTGLAVFYGWTLGQSEGRVYLLYVQSFGTWLRSWFVRPTPVV